MYRKDEELYEREVRKERECASFKSSNFLPFSQRDEYRDSTVKESKLQEVGKDTLEKICFMLRESQRETLFPSL